MFNFFRKKEENIEIKETPQINDESIFSENEKKDGFKLNFDFLKKAVSSTAQSLVENVVDMAMPNIHPLAKNAKDIASGAVLFGCFVAIIVGIIIFLPKIINLF